MNAATFVIWVGVCATCLAGDRGRQHQGAADAAKAFGAASADLRAVWQLMTSGGEPMRAAETAEAQARLEKAMAGDSPSAGFIGRYLSGRLAILSGNRAKADEILVGSLELATGAECVYGMRDRRPLDREHRYVYEECLAALVPISTWQSDCDMRRSDLTVFYGGRQVYILDGPRRPLVPAVSREKMLEAARSIETSGLFDHAWRGYAEAVYAGFSPRGLPRSRENPGFRPRLPSTGQRLAAARGSPAGRNSPGIT